MASILSYEPLPRYGHNAQRVGSKLVLQGGRTIDFKKNRRQQLSSVVEVFHPYSGAWEQIRVEGQVLPPGRYFAASASLNDSLFSFGGCISLRHSPNLTTQYFNTLYRLDTGTWRWSEVSPQNAHGAPMSKCSCGMVALRNSLLVFGGYGIPVSSFPESESHFVKASIPNDGRGWTNEFHIYNISEGMWICPVTSGERPPPCAGLTLTAIDGWRAVMFGGRNEKLGFMNDVYIINIFTMSWAKLKKSGLWPEKRNFHAACCLNYGQQFPQLIVTGGRDSGAHPLSDIWILDVDKGDWKEENTSVKARSGHSITAFRLDPGLTEVILFGGTPSLGEEQPKITNTVLLHFRLVESSGLSWWALLFVIDIAKCGSHQRLERVRGKLQVADLRRFCAVPYYTNIRLCSFDVHLFVAPQRDIFLKEINSKVKKQYQNLEGGPVSFFELDGGNSIINLVLPEHPVLGWTMKHCNTDKIILDDTPRKQPITRLQLSVSWAGTDGEPLKKLEQNVALDFGEKTITVQISSPQRSSTPLSDERAQQIIEKALESSSFNMRNVVGVITGLMGSGKTCLLSRFFNQAPPDLYSSTGLAEQSLRGLLRHLINVSFSSWEHFTHKQILEFLASLFYDSLPVVDEVLAPSPPMHKNKPIISPVSPSTESSPMSSRPSSPSLPTSPVTGSSAMQSMVGLVKTPKASGSQNRLELVHMIDTGGQPELLESLPSLINHSHLAILVLNLMFGLDEYPTIDYHEKGKAYKRALPFHYSNRQMMQKLASTLQAKRFSQEGDQCYQLLVVATHRDCVQEGELQARVKAFDQALRTILLPSTNDELICFSANQIPFVLNLKNPDKDDMTQLDLIRDKISGSEVGENVKIPGSFLVFEQVLVEFATLKVKRDILSLSECLLIGEKLKMKPEEVEAALIFFHRQFTLLYFRHVLPDLVFTRPQTPLDCINAIVGFSYKVESGEVKGIKGSLVSHLRDGIITEEILSHELLSQFFIPGIYEPRHAIDLLCHTFSLAPLNHELQCISETTTYRATSQKLLSVKREKREYLMMSLRPAIPNKDIPQHLPPPSDIAPLVITFTNNCVPLSCFSRTISCLMAIYDWKLSRAENGSPQCLAHNIVSLYRPQTPGQIVLVDVGHSIQVHIKLDSHTKTHSFHSICFQVRETIFAAINQVFELLNHAKIEVSHAFLCSCPREPLAHTASAYLFQSQWLLHCSIAEKDNGLAQSKHTVWLDVPALEQKKPSLPKCLKLKIPQKVGANFMQFGILLLDDEDCTLVDAIRKECNNQCEEIVRRILVEWVRGRGRALTWKSLIDTLRDCDLHFLADNIDTIHNIN